MCMCVVVAVADANPSPPKDISQGCQTSQKTAGGGVVDSDLSSPAGDTSSGK